MDDSTDDRPTAQWKPVGVDGDDMPTQVVNFQAPRTRPMPTEQASPPPAVDQSTTQQPASDQEPADEPTTAVNLRTPQAPPATERELPPIAAMPTQELPAQQAAVPEPAADDEDEGPQADTTPAAPADAQPSASPVGAIPPVTPPPASPSVTPASTTATSAPLGSSGQTAAQQAAGPRPTADEDPEPALHAAMATAGPGTGYDDLPAPEVRAGDVFAGRYRLEQQLAERGGALTWRAFDQKLSRSVLVHILRHDDPRTGDVLEAARKAAFATDSRFLRVLDAVPGEEPGSPSLVVCEFAPGESLERLLRQGPLSALEAAWVARELADALSAMHAEGLFHQRINPDTVIITSTGNVKIVGFLIEAAMYPDAEDGTLAWSERESADVLALGKVLYASLVTRWPTPRDQMLDADGQPRITWGMPAAPMDGRGWLTPRQIRSGVSPALDVICDQVLSDAPRHNELPLRTASQVVLALNKVLGTADAAADLERRMRYPVVPVGQQGRPDASNPSLDTTARLRAVGRDDQRSGAPAAGAAGKGSTGQGTDGQRQTGGSSSPGHTPQAKAAAASVRRGPANRPQPRRWLWILVGLVALAIIAGLVRLMTHSDTSSKPATSGAPAVVAISSIDDFDPTTDGGNGEENPDEAKLADDGNPATAWQTVTYLNDPALGKLKPGVGLVLDLGHSQKVGAVKLTLQGTGTTVQLRVPATPATDKPPMTSVKQWSVVASSTASGTSVTLTPTSQVETRYLLVYLTKLPKVAANKYRGGIAEIEVTS